MKKIAKMFATASLAVAMSTGAVSANNINNTGPGSTNTINSSNNNTCVVSNNNTIGATNTSNQTATSGSATSSGNTNGGSATSGSSSNNNSSSTSVYVTNAGRDGKCPAGSTAVPAGSPAAQAAAAGQGGVKFDKKGNVIGGRGAALPETGANDTIKAAAIAVAAVLGVAAVGQVGFSAFRRNSL